MISSRWDALFWFLFGLPLRLVFGGSRQFDKFKLSPRYRNIRETADVRH